jgi:hypothetical protein
VIKTLTHVASCPYSIINTNIAELTDFCLSKEAVIRKFSVPGSGAV